MGFGDSFDEEDFVQNDDASGEDKNEFLEPQSEYEVGEGKFDKVGNSSMISYKDSVYQSKEMRTIMSLNEPDEKIPSGLSDISYKSSNVFPEWVLTNPVWRKVSTLDDSGNVISDILKIPVSKRTGDQVSTIVHWLMSVWKIAATMGFKRCNQMFREFKYTEFEPGENIITEGERGLTFYIIVSGNTAVYKEGIGMVGQLSKGKIFGEIALTQGKDLRTATVQAATKTEVLSLHKENYDYFVKDLLDAEKRENFQILTQCKLFKAWPKGKIEKMCNSCTRKTFEAGERIFQQGDPPEDLYVIIDGSVNIIKELIIVSKNRWPTAVDAWTERTKKIHKPMILSTLNRGSFFGEVAIIKNIPRSTSAVAVSRTMLISLDKLEFLHLISYGKSNFTTSESAEQMDFDVINKYIGDKDVLNSVSHLKGGPQSAIAVGTLSRSQSEIKSKSLIKPVEFSKGKGWKQMRKTKSEKTPKNNHLAQGSLQDQLIKVSHKDDVLSAMKKAASDTVKDDKIRKDKSIALLGLNSASTHSNSNNNSNSKTPRNRDGSPVNRMTGFFRSRLETARRSSSVGFAKRNSLVGLDNDTNAPVNSAFGGKVLLRKHSSMRLDDLYDSFYRKLQSENMQGMNTAEGAIMIRDNERDRRSTRSQSIFNNISRAAVTSHTINTVSPMNYIPTTENPNSHIVSPMNKHRNSLLLSPKFKPNFDANPNESAENDSGSEGEGGAEMMASHKPFASNTSATNFAPTFERQDSSQGHGRVSLKVNIHQPMELYHVNSGGIYPIGDSILSPLGSPMADSQQDTGRRRRSTHRGSMIGSNSLKLLNKPIISYRDAMEG